MNPGEKYYQKYGFSKIGAGACNKATKIKYRLAAFLMLGVLFANAQNSTYTANVGVITPWTVPCGVTTITVAINGAAGGSGDYLAAGNGVSFTQDITVTPGDVLEIAPGKKGVNSGGYAGGGGGGSFVYDNTTSTLLAAAGGGGGGGYRSTGVDGGSIGMPGSKTTSSNDNTSPPTQVGYGGQFYGPGMGGGVPLNTKWSGGGGAGWLGNGITSAGPSGGGGGQDYVNGLIAGAGGGGGANGGFGGGGGGGYNGGGGGGGYNGGGGGEGPNNNDGWGGSGGGSGYWNGANFVNPPSITSGNNVAAAQNVTGDGAITITYKTPMSLSSQSSTNETCNGGAVATATVNVTLGTSPYTYAWNPSGQTNQTATGLSAGTYTVTVTDGHGCTVTASYVITQPPAITAGTTTISETCGKGNGSATVSVGGGTGAYTYSWAPGGSTNATASGLSTGNYTVTVTDANGCSQTALATVGSTGSPTATSTETNETCNDGTTGTATAKAAGGTPGYTYSWSPSGGTNATATGLSAGTYSCTITDANGCTTTDVVTITEPSAVTASVVPTNASCGNSNGSATVTATGGTGQYSYSWSPGGGTNATVSGLGAGNYTVTVTDANGCSQTATTSIGNVAGLTSTYTENNPLCNGGITGNAIINVNSGTSPYTYVWSNGETTSGITGLSAGTYTCTVTDANGCTTEDTITLADPPVITANASANGADCGGTDGSALVTASGGTGALTYSWSAGGGTNASASNLSSGTYTCTITDANGCSTTASATVTSIGGIKVAISPDVTINSGDSTMLTATGGGTYSWSPAAGLSCTTCANPVASPDFTTTYCVVADSNGCKDSACVTITIESPCTRIFVPTAFSPNGDHNNDLECVYGDCIQDFYFIIYDRWGNKVFETNDSKQCWDGTYKGQMLNSGVFDYYLKVTLNNGKNVSQKGNITLLR